MICTCWLLLLFKEVCCKVHVHSLKPISPQAEMEGNITPSTRCFQPHFKVVIEGECRSVVERPRVLTTTSRSYQYGSEIVAAARGNSKKPQQQPRICPHRGCVLLLRPLVMQLLFLFSVYPVPADSAGCVQNDRLAFCHSGCCNTRQCMGRNTE